MFSYFLFSIAVHRLADLNLLANMSSTVARILFATVAFGALCFCLWNVSKLLWLSFRGRTAFGVVTKMTEWSGRSGHGYQPTVRFTDENGVEYQFRSSSSGENPNTGVRVKIKYSRSHPGIVAEISDQLGALRAKYIGFSLLCVFMIVGMYVAT
jgi:hypothetical protein